MVLTSKDFNQEEKKADLVQEKPSPKFEGVTTYRFLCPFASMGKSKVAFFHKGEEKQLEIIDKVFSCKDKEEHNSLKDMLLNAGFIDASNTVAVEVKVEPVKPKIYTYGHPDNSPDKKVNGSIAITVDGKEVKLACKNGVIKTTRKDVVEVLASKGYYFVKEEEIAE